MQLPDIELHYGAAQPMRLPFDGDRFRSFHAGPPPLDDVRDAAGTALTQPADFPPLAALCVPGDRVTLVLDRQLTAAGAVLAEIIGVLQAAGVEPDQVLILQPPHWQPRTLADPRAELPEPLRSAVQWKIHDPTVADGAGYLAASVSGERIYLSRDVLDADVVIPLFAAEFNPVVGYRNAGSLLYPWLSNVDAIRKALGEGHPELRPDSDRPLRQLGDEICWLLGLQFAVSVVPSRIPGRPAAIFGGQFEAVQRQTQQLLDRNWSVQLDRRAELIVVSISQPSADVGWEEIGAGLALAQKLVVRDGRIIVLSSLTAQPGPGLEMLRSSRSAKAALLRMRKEAPPDLVSSAQIASAAAWAGVSLLSGLDSTLVDDLQLTSLSSPAEAERLIAQAEDIVLIDGGEHMWGEIVAG